MPQRPKQVKEKGLRKNIGNKSQANAIHGLVGLELTALRKTFNGQTKYNFENYLNDNIPDCYPIEFINTEDEWKKLKDYLIPVNASEISVHSFESLKQSIKGDYSINLIDHKPPLIESLGDDRFIKAHERLAKHEKKFVNEDTQKIANEVDNSLELLSILGIDLKRTNMKETLENLRVDEIELNEDQIFRLSQILGTITYIKDHTDTAEMILKFKLTLRELRTFLLSYLRMKSFEGLLKQRISDEDFELFEPPKTGLNEEPMIKEKVSITTTNGRKPRKKPTPKYKVKINIVNLARFKEIVENAPKVPRKKRGPYKKRAKNNLQTSKGNSNRFSNDQKNIGTSALDSEMKSENKVVDEPGIQVDSKTLSLEDQVNKFV